MLLAMIVVGSTAVVALVMLALDRAHFLPQSAPEHTRSAGDGIEVPRYALVCVVGVMCVWILAWLGVLVAGLEILRG